MSEAPIGDTERHCKDKMGMDVELVVVEVFPDEVSGELARGYLESNGIPAFLRDGGVVGTGLGSVDATAAYVLLVQQEDRPDADELLNAVDGNLQDVE